MVQAIGGTAPARIDTPANNPVANTSPAQLPDVTAAPDSTTKAAAVTAPTAVATAAPSAPPSPTRVVVEPGANKFVLVFKVLDNVTGDVLAEIPHQTPQQAAQNPNYSAGSLLNQKV